MAVPQYALIEYTMRGQVPMSSGRVRTVGNVFHFYNPGVVGIPNMAILIANLDGTIQNAVAALLATQYTGINSLIRDMFREDAPAVVTGSTPINGGGTAGDRLPLSACVCYLIQTPTRGRGRQGRKFFAPIPEADTLLDRLTAARLTAWQGLAGALAVGVTDGSVNTWQPVILSRASLVYTAGVLQSFTAANVTLATVDSNIHNLKRRRDIVSR
jgi:hypothetical protein